MKLHKNLPMAPRQPEVRNNPCHPMVSFNVNPENPPNRVAADCKSNKKISMNNINGAANQLFLK